MSKHLSTGAVSGQRKSGLFVVRSRRLIGMRRSDPPQWPPLAWLAARRPSVAARTLSSVFLDRLSSSASSPSIATGQRDADDMVSEDHGCRDKQVGDRFPGKCWMVRPPQGPGIRRNCRNISDDPFSDSITAVVCAFSPKGLCERCRARRQFWRFPRSSVSWLPRCEGAPRARVPR
jgi:hypothetical protein